MKINIKTVNIELNDALESYIQNKIGGLARFLENVDQSVQIMDVEVGKPSAHHKKGNVFHVYANLEVPGKLLRADAKDWDLHVAIDEVRDELKRQIKRYKEKPRDLSRQVKK